MQTRPTPYSRGSGPRSESSSDPEGSAPPARPPIPADDDAGTASAQAGADGAGSPWAPRNWKIRTRFVAVVSIPLVLAVIFGVLRISSYIGDARTLQQIQTLAMINGEPTSGVSASTQQSATITTVTSALQQDRLLAAGYLGSHSPADKAAFAKQQGTTDPQVASLIGQLNGLGGSYPTVLSDAITGAVAELRNVSVLENEVLNPSPPSWNEVNGEFSNEISALLNVTGLLSSGTTDDSMRTAIQGASQLAQATETFSATEAQFDNVLSAGQMDRPTAAALALASVQANQAFSQISALAPPGSPQTYGALLAATVQPVEAVQQAIVSGAEQSLTPITATHTPAKEYLQTVQPLMGQLASIQSGLDLQLVGLASVAHQTTVRDAIDYSVLIIMALLLALIATSLVGRAMVGRVRALRASALDAAETNLPMAIAGVEEAGGSLTEVGLPSLAMPTTDEIGDLSRAFDQVQGEALRLAAEQARLRATVNAMFVNLARRSQSLVERQLRLIDELEQSEQDPDQLQSLFRLDHLATRMRRNGENLLVLAGQESERRWSRPVPLVDLLRAATSEVEQYERIQLQTVTNVDLAGRTVNDIVHLVAELLENATLYSSPETEVVVRSQPVTGGILLEVSDQGIGMTQGELQEANERLAQPPAVDVSVSRRMGLFVVSRLAFRHGIRVQLRRSVAGGITAFVMFPDDIVERPNATGEYPSEADAQPFDARPFESRAFESQAFESRAFDGEPADAEPVGAERFSAERFSEAEPTPLFAGAGHAASGRHEDAEVFARDTGTFPRDEVFSREASSFAAPAAPTTESRTRPDEETLAGGSQRSWGAAQAFAGAAAAQGRRRPTTQSSPDGSGGLFTPPTRGAGRRTDEFDDIGDDSGEFTAPRRGGWELDDLDTRRGNAAGAEPPAPDDEAEDRPPVGGGAPTSTSVPLPRRSVSRRTSATASNPVPDDWEPRSSERGEPRTRPDVTVAGTGNSISSMPAPMPTRRPGQTYGPGSHPTRVNRPSTPAPPDDAPDVGHTSLEARPTPSPLPPTPTPQQVTRRPAPDLPAGPTPRALPGPGPRQNPAPHILDASTPVAAEDATEVRLPIYEAVESEWFRRRTGRPRSANPDDALGASLVTGPIPNLRRPTTGEHRRASWTDETPDGPPTAASPRPPLNAPRTSLSENETGALPQRPRSEPLSTQADEPDARQSLEETGSWRSPGDEGWRAAEAVRTPSANGLTAAGLPIRVPKAHLVPGTAKEGRSTQSQGRPPTPAREESAKRSPEAIRSRLSSFQRGIHQGRMAGRQGPTSTQDTSNLPPTTESD